MKKKLFPLFLFSFLLIIFCSRVDAESMSPLWVHQHVSNISSNPYTFNFTGQPFKDAGEGYVIGALNITSAQPISTPSIYLHSSTLNACEIISTNSSIHNSEYVFGYSIKCPITFKNGKYLDYFSITTRETFTYDLDVLGVWSFITTDMTNEQLAEIIGILKKTDTSSVNENINKINDSINNSDISSTGTDVDAFTNNELFDDSTGIISIVKAPLNFLNALTTSSCTPITLPFPHTDKKIVIPCMQSYLSQYLPSSLITLIKLVINGFIVYRVLTSLALSIHEYKDPDTDRLEVLEL